MGSFSLVGTIFLPKSLTRQPVRYLSLGKKWRLHVVVVAKVAIAEGLAGPFSETIAELNKLFGVPTVNANVTIQNGIFQVPFVERNLLVLVDAAALYFHDVVRMTLGSLVGITHG